MAHLATLVLGDTPDSWAALGFSVEAGGLHAGGVRHHFQPGTGKGITAWALSGVSVTGGAIDGLPTASVPPAPAPPPPAPTETDAPPHPNGVVAVDHVVVVTPDLGRTVGAFEALDMRVLRTRESDTYGAPMAQAFFGLGSTILEVVGPPTSMGDGDARWFGIAYTVDDLDRTARYLGAQLHPAKEAVQPGRRIATLDRAAGIRTRLAFMSR